MLAKEHPLDALFREADLSYEAPSVEELGSAAELTQQFDKIGDDPDFLTPDNPLLDGSIVPD